MIGLFYKDAPFKTFPVRCAHDSLQYIVGSLSCEITTLVCAININIAVFSISRYALFSPSPFLDGVATKEVKIAYIVTLIMR